MPRQPSALGLRQGNAVRRPGLDSGPPKALRALTPLTPCCPPPPSDPYTRGSFRPEAGEEEGGGWTARALLQSFL
eukprot:scaffold1130_cov127-Isochrysis_galbana.AAC.1